MKKIEKMKTIPKLLIVDDEDLNIEFLVQSLSCNYDIKVAYSAKEALRLLDKFFDINLMLIDIHMPDMDGFEFVEKIINNERTKDIPFVFLTADDSDDTISKGFELGALDFLIKPLDSKIFNQKFKVYSRYLNKTIENKKNIFLAQQYKNTIDSTSIVSKTDHKGIIKYVNEKFCEISGFSQDELIGKPHNIVRHPDNSSKMFEEIWDTIKNKKQIWSGEVKNKKKDGSSYWVQANISPILDINGNVLEYIGIRTDITQQKKIQEYFENQMNISNKEFDKAMHLTKQYEKCIDQKNAILRTDPDNFITYANKKFCEVAQCSEGVLHGLNCSKLRDKSHIEAGDCEMIKQKLSKKESVQITFKNISNSGKVFYMDTLVYPIEDVDGNVIEHLHLMNDVTEIIELSQEIEDTQKEVVFTMGAIGESRSKETGLHVKRVAEYSYLLAKLYGLSEEEAVLLKQASPMHDIGKVGIADSILNKPGKLTNEEFETMKSHSEIGYEMLKHSNRPILKTAAIVAKEHHEKWDGTGYPNGLKGEDIHIFGRITAVADVFDALGHDRVYKKAWPLDDILDLFEQNKGKHFDPKLIDIFINNLDKFLKIKEELETFHSRNN